MYSVWKPPELSQDVKGGISVKSMYRLNDNLSEGLATKLPIQLSSAGEATISDVIGNTPVWCSYFESLAEIW